MADEPEDISEAPQKPGAPQDPAWHQRTYARFLEDLRQRTPLPVERVEKVLTRVLCALKQELVVEAEEDLRAQLPLKLQQVLQSCEPRHDHASCRADLEGLLTQVAAELDTDKDQAESVTRAVLATVRAQLTEGEAEHVSGSLSLAFRVLWARPI